MIPQYLAMLALALPAIFLAGLAALWAVTSRRHWFWRTLSVVAWLTLVGLARAPELLLLFTAQFVTIAALVLTRRRRLRRADQKSTDRVVEIASGPQGWQFSLRDVLLCVFLAAIFMPALSGLRGKDVDSAWLYVMAGTVCGAVCCLAALAVLGPALVKPQTLDSFATGGTYPPPTSRWWLRYVVAFSGAGGLGALLGLACINIKLTSLAALLNPPDSLLLPRILLLMVVALWLMQTVWLLLWPVARWRSEPIATLDEPDVLAAPLVARRWQTVSRVLLGMSLLVITSVVVVVWCGLALVVPNPPDVAGAEQEARLAAIARQLNWSAIPNQDVDEVLPDACERFSSSNAGRLKEAREILAGPCGVRVIYMGFDVSSLGNMRELARSFDAQSRAAMAGGDVESAAIAGTDCFRLGSRGQRGGLIINKLVGVAIEGVGTRVLADAARRLDREQWRMLDSELAAEESDRESLDDIFAREYAWAMNANGWFGRIEYLVERLLMGPGVEPHRTSLENCEARLLAQLRLLRTTMAIRFYRQDEGHFPPSLAALVPNWLDAVPLDPFSDQAFVYRADDEGYLLYSVGPNQVDDGGRMVSSSDIMQEGDLFLEMFRLDEIADAEQQAAIAAEAAEQAGQLDAGVEP